MLEILLLAVPVIVSTIVELQKKLLSIKYSASKGNILRTTAMILSFAGSLIISFLDGDGLSPLAIQEIVVALVSYGATQIPYHFGKKKKV